MNKKTEDNKVTKTAKTDLTKIEKKAESKKAAKSSVKISSFKKKKKIKRNITSGVAYVYSTFNNTIISIADESGNVIAGLQPELRDLKDLENLHLMPPK